MVAGVSVEQGAGFLVRNFLQTIGINALPIL
jgi:hypothetical protein